MVASFLKKSASVLSLRQTNILSAAMVIMATVLFSALLGLVRVRLLSNYFGDSRTLDIYWAAFRLPDMIFQLLVMGTVSSAFIPVFSSYLGKNDKKTAFMVANSIITVGFFIFVALTIIIFIFSKELSRLLAPGFSAEEIKLMSKLTQIMIIGQVFFVIGNFLTGILQSFHRFLLPAIAPIVYNVGIIIGTVLLSPSIGIYGPTYGVVFGTILFFLIQLPFTIKLGWIFKPSINLKHPGVIEISKLMLPRILSLGVSQIEYTVDLMIASLFAAGHYTVFTFAIFLIGLPTRLFGATIGQASLPTLSLDVAKGNLETYKKTLTKSFMQIIYLVLPASIIILILRVPLVRIAFGSKSFSWDATILTSKVVAILTIAIIAQSLTQLLVRGFYAFHNTKTPFIIGIVSVLVNVISSLLFALLLKMGVVGLAISTSLSSLISTLLLLFFIIKKTGEIEDKIIFSFIKNILATGIMAFILYLLMRVLDLFVFDTSRTINLIFLTVITLLIGTTSYLIFSKLLKIEEVDSYIKILGRVKEWKQILEKNEEIIETNPETTQPQSQP